MKHKIKLIISFLLWGCSFVHAAVLPSLFAETRLTEKLDATFMKYSPDDRVFVIQKPGIVNILQDGSQTPLVCMDIRDKVDNYDERGAQTIAFDPDFSNNGYFYLYYAVKGGNHNRVSRFTIQGNVCDPNSEVILLDLDTMEAAIHNGGVLFFQDDKLFITTGDGGSYSTSQSLGSLLGKVLRINKDGTIPTDNPSYGQTTGKYRAIYALGLRNPFSASVNPADGRVFINDVGRDTWEEVNVLSPGANFGWPTIEGKRTDQNPPANYHEPSYVYRHEGGGLCAIVGSTFYSPTTATFPNEYVGKYFYGDYCTNKIYVLDPDTFTLVGEFASEVVGAVSFDAAPNGDFYYLARGGVVRQNTRAFKGEVYRVKFTNSNVPTFSFQPGSILTTIGIDATFSVGASGESLTYQWYRDGAAITGATSRLYTLTAPALADNNAVFKVSVTNSHGTIESNEAVLTVTSNTPPVVTIVTPVEGQKYSAGTKLEFSGRATDAEDGELYEDNFSWVIDFHHADHTHPGLTVDRKMADHYEIPSVHESASNVWYRIYLNVTDNSGASTTVHRDIMPNLATVTLTSSPPGLSIKLDGADRVTPYTFASVVGIRRTLETFNQTVDGVNYNFESWSDNGAILHTIIVPSQNETFTAVFRAQNVSDAGSGGDSNNNPDGAGSDPSKGAVTISVDEADGGLSGGAIAGIVAGSVVFIGAVVGGYFFYKAKFAKKLLPMNSPEVATPLP